MKKILYVISRVYDSKEYEGLVQHWDRRRSQVEFVLLNTVPDCKTQRAIRARGFTCTTLPYRSRWHAPRTLLHLMRILRSKRPDVVHVNLLEASLLGLLAGRLTGIGRLVVTRHHTLHNHLYHPVRGVLYDRLINALAHRIIAITGNVVQVLVEKEGVDPRKITVIHHGFDLYGPNRPDPVVLGRLRAKYDLAPDHPHPLVGVIARPFSWKGLDQVIPAFRTLLSRWPDARLMLFHWNGAHAARYDRMLALLPGDRWRTVRWETEIDQFYHLFDVFVHVPEEPLSEPFGYVYVEALTAGVPSVFTRSGLLRDLDPEQLGGVTQVPFKDPKAVAEAVAALVEQGATPADRLSWAERNIAQLRPAISVERKMKDLQTFYDGL